MSDATPDMRCSRWPDAADSASVAGLSLYVYRDTAMIQPPPEDYDGSRDAWLSVEDLRGLAAAATWAADRLDAR